MKTKTKLQHVAWSTAANIYEVNVRQFTPEGTFAALEQHLPRLVAMGVDIVWLMPIQPIGQFNRKGSLGSYYSVNDYVSVNPEFGTLDDFKHLVQATQALGMRLIIDWVPNHTAWDHPWVTQHPEWYKKDAAGQIHSYVHDNGKELEHWTDVVGLDYEQPALWTAMIDALTYWVTETGIDGYRCDVAGLLPTPFWDRARAELDAIKPVFMLAEWSGADLHRAAFDMTYDWDLYDVMTDIADGKVDVNALVEYWDQRQAEYAKNDYRMTFTSNHDKNSWEGSDTERFGVKFKAFAVLAATLPGMPLLYGGQESVLDRRLAFFEKDAIDWKSCELADFYASLFKLKHDNPCLWNGEQGADLTLLPISSTRLFAFKRELPDNGLALVFNFSDETQIFDWGGVKDGGQLAPWGYLIERL